MSLIATEIKELRELLGKVKRGEIKPEFVRAQLQIYKETHKRAKLYLDLYVASGNPGLTGKFDNIISSGDDLKLLE